MSKEEKVCLNVIIGMINYATEEILKFDDEFKNKLEGVSEVVQWKIGNDIAYYTEIKEKNIKGYDGIATNPTITFEISSEESALKVLTGKIDMAKLGKEIKISGDASKIQKLAIVMDTVRNYIGDLAA